MSFLPGPGVILSCQVKQPKTKLERFNADLKAAGCGTQIVEGTIEVMEERTSRSHYPMHYWGGRFKRKGKGWVTLYCVLNIGNGVGSVIIEGNRARAILDKIAKAKALAAAKEEEASNETAE